MRSRDRKVLLAAGTAMVLSLGLAAQVPAQVNPSGILTADDCVQIAMEHNHSLGQAEAGVAGARGTARSGWREVLPSISTSAGYSLTKYDRVISGRYDTATGQMLTSDKTYSGSASLNASEQITLSGIKSFGSSRARLAASEFDLEATAEEVEVGTREQFYSIVAAIKLAEVEENAVEVAREQLRRAETLFNLGSVARSDVLQAKVNLAESDMNLINRRNVVRVEHSRLSLIMGLDPMLDITIDPTLSIPAQDPTGSIEEWIGRARQQRPDLRASESQLRAAELSESSAKFAYLPSLGASYTLSRRASSDVEQWLDDSNEQNGPNTQWTIGAQLSMTLFDGFAREGRIQSAVAEKRSRELVLDQLGMQIVVEVKDAFLNIQKERESLRAAQSSVSLAEENLRLQQALYESGAGTLLEWDNARLDLRRARVSLIQAEINLVLSHIRFEKAVGE